MSSSSKRRAKDDAKNDDVFPKKRSLVDYSKISDRHVDDARYEKQRQQAAGQQQSSSSALMAPGVKMSSQMQAVMRLMTGKEERTIAEKIADSNRPTWEQYKKDNQDKLEITGVDQRKMEEYRRELDKEREKILSRGLNHGGGKKSKGGSSNSDDDDDSSRSGSGTSESSSRKKKNKKKHKDKKHGKQHGPSRSSSSRKRKHKHRKHRHHHKINSDNSDTSDDERRHRKITSSIRKKSKRSKGKGDGAEDADKGDDACRLSSFFAEGGSSSLDDST